MTSENKKHKNGNNGTIKKIAVIFLLLLGAFFYATDVNAQAVGTNIEVCVQPPDPILTDPNSPVLQYQTKYHPFYYYQIQISKDASFSSILYDAGIKAYQSTFSYNRVGTTSCTWLGCTFTPTVIESHPTPRCACDTDPNSLNCGTPFGASGGDPAVCYDWYTYTTQTLTGYGPPCWIDYEYSSCGSMYGGSDSPGCGPVWAGEYYLCQCCTPQYQTDYHDASYRYDKVENPTAMPVGTYSHTVPPGTLPIDGSTYYYRVRVKDAYDWSPYAVGNFFLGATDGVCGTGLSFCDGTTITPATPGLCAPGTPINISGNPSGPWSWICDGLYGGNSSGPCSASVTPTTDCGTRTACAGDVLSCQPGMCSNGGTCAMTGDTTWTCTDSCGTNQSCSAIVNPVEDGQCGTADGEPICDGRILSGGELCASGSPSPAAPDTTGYDVSWQCLGSCGGSNESCGASGKKSCGWIETNP